MKYKVDDIVLIKTFAGPKVWVKLKERILKPKDGYGADGWTTQMIYKKDVDNLRRSGVPLERNTKPTGFVFDWQLIKRKN